MAGAPLFDTLLIANRGEIACRVIRTARAMGLRTVAVYSEADRGALHARMADQAICIGPAAARDSYLKIDNLIQACQASGAQAVHPGYGFLSENAEFSRACRTAGLVFVGPPPEAIDALGNKSAAKLLAQRIGVPCLPGYAGAEQSADRLIAEARRVGGPLMIKAAAGGGGRGMRRCDDLSDEAVLRALIEAARSEAQASFGNGDLLLERLLESARHIEVQVFGDTLGHQIHLGERDCSTQRRNQKILEEAPAPGVTSQLREQMGAAAVRLAREVAYTGAGTIEFLLAPDGQFYFLEMNTRLQVEHPVTEAVTGLDLVEWQLRVAQGEPLPLRQQDIRWQGHAIEARLCAEDAFAGYVPQSGSIVAWRAPAGNGVRVDHGLAPTAQVPPHYDSMIAKVITLGTSRDDARRKLIQALRDTTVFGITTNRDYLCRCLQAPAFSEARLSTRWLSEATGGWTAPVADRHWHGVAAALLVHQAGRRHGDLANWSSTGLRSVPSRIDVQGTVHAVAVQAAGRQAYCVCDDQGSIDIVIESDRDQHTLLQGGAMAELHISVAGRGRQVRAWLSGTSGCLDMDGVSAPFTDVSQAPPVRNDGGATGTLVARMHGLVVNIAVETGQKVAKGDLLLAIEAMKMEHRIEAPIAGTVAEIGAAKGQQVAPGKLLVRIDHD